MWDSERILPNFLFGMLWVLLPISAYATSEYDIYRKAVVTTPTPVMILLDVSLNMSCSPGQQVPVGGPAYCPYDTSGIPPFKKDPQKVLASRLTMVRESLADLLSQESVNYAGDHSMLGLAMYSGEGGVIRLPPRELGSMANDQFQREAFKEILQDLAVQGEAPLLGSLMEVGRYFAKQPVVFGLSRQTLDHEFHHENALAARLVGFSPRWLAQRISDPSALENGNPLLVRDADCSEALAFKGIIGENDPACENEHYIAYSAQSILYKGVENPLCNTGIGKNHHSMLNGKIVIIASQDMMQSGDLDHVVAGERLGVWLNRFLSEDNATTSLHPACRSSSSETTTADLQICIQQVATLLNERHGVTISVIGLGVDSSHLQGLAAAGGGSYYSVDDKRALETVLLQETAFTESLPVPIEAGFAVPVNSSSGFNHDNRLYLPVFQPANNRLWHGNLKRYRLDKRDGKPVILSDSGTEKTTASEVVGTCENGQSGCIRTDARSAWGKNSTPDGNVVTRGGAAENQPSLTDRKIYVQLGAHLAEIDPAASLERIRDAELANLKNISSLAVLEKLATHRGWNGKGDLDQIPSSVLENALNDYNWLAGVDKNDTEYERLKSMRPSQHPFHHNDEERNYLGATVFGAPVLVSYAITSKNSQEKTIAWISGNDGFLRAIDTSDGKEIVAIFPEALLRNVKSASSPAVGEPIMGLDSTWVVFRHDRNKDGKILAVDDDFVYLYGGMRRGGKHVFGFDVTTPEAPKVLFDIDNFTKGFESIGQTWSTPILAQVVLPGKKKPEVVLVFGGGYDNSRDPQSNSEYEGCSSAMTSCGAAIYFVAAEGAGAGKLRWVIDAKSTGSKHTRHSDLTAPVVAPVKSLDIDGDGITDYFYSVDMNGQVFRIAMGDNINSKPSVGTLAKLADFKNNSTADDRRFFFPPSVALIKPVSGAPYVALALGSGDITIPDAVEVKDYLFLLKDLVPLGGEQSTPILSINPSNEVFSLDSETAIANHLAQRLEHALLLTLALPEPGEKVFGAPIIVNNQAFYSTYIPPSQGGNACVVEQGNSRIAGFSVLSGKQIFDNSGSINPNSSISYFSSYSAPTGAGRMVPVLLSDGSITLMSGVQALNSGEYSDTFSRLRWRRGLSGTKVKNL